MDEDILMCNEWLAAPENDKAPKWLRDLMIATIDWVQDIRDMKAKEFT